MSIDNAFVMSTLLILAQLLTCYFAFMYVVKRKKPHAIPALIALCLMLLRRISGFLTLSIPSMEAIKVVDVHILPFAITVLWLARFFHLHTKGEDD